MKEHIRSYDNKPLLAKKTYDIRTFPHCIPKEGFNIFYINKRRASENLLVMLNNISGEFHNPSSIHVNDYIHIFIREYCTEMTEF